MLDDGKKLGAFIVPTGIGASIGGYAGDASPYASMFSKISKLIVNPNVVNAGCFSGINENMLYVEGYAIDQFFKGEINLVPSKKNKIGLVFDKRIPKDVLNVHINTLNAVRAVYGINVSEYIVTNEEVGVDFQVEGNGISTGSVKNIETLLEASKILIERGFNAIGIICFFEDPEDINSDYAHGIGVDPVGGVEAILSHYIVKELQVPCAHSPAFEDYQIYPQLVDGKAASEYITPTFLPCILLGLDNAPLISKSGGININNLDYLVMPYDSLGSTPVFEALKRDIPIYVIKENKTELNVNPNVLKIAHRVHIIDSYKKCCEIIERLC